MSGYFQLYSTKQKTWVMAEEAGWQWQKWNDKNYIETAHIFNSATHRTHLYLQKIRYNFKGQDGFVKVFFLNNC